MDARVKQVREILAAPGDQYLVPFFQRHYSWRTSEWQRLWNDIEQLLEPGDAGSQHFLGPLVCTPTGHVPGEITPYLLIDGQQRLTTMTVLLAALRDFAEECSLGELAEEITEEYLVHKRQKKLNRYRLLPRTGDREVLIGIINGDRKDLERPNGLLKARRFFHRKIRDYSQSSSELGPVLREIFNAVRNRLSLVVITIDGENPYEIFESLNSTGLPLEQSDLVRNYVFMQVPLDEQDDFNEEMWQPLETIFESPPLHQTRFYRHYLMRDGRYSLKNSTFVDFKEAHRARKLSPTELVQELREHAEFERWLIHPATCERLRIRRSLVQLDAVDASTAHPLAMSLLARHHRGEIDEDTLVGCLGDLMSFVLRRSMCGENTRTYSRWFVEAITKLGDNPRQGLQSYLIFRGWPDDYAFKSALAEFSLYRRERSKARLMLEELERDFGHKEQVELDEKLSIEHVLPQTVGDNKYGMAWKKMLGAEWEQDHNNLLHTLGNLTLTGYNPSLSNRPYGEKQGLLLESHLELNKCFAEIESWNAKTIRARGTDLAERLAKLWDRPEGAAYVPEVKKETPKDTTKGKWSAKELRLEYWSRFIDRLESSESTLASPKLKGRTWLRIPTGKNGYWLTVWASPKTRVIGVGFMTTGATRVDKLVALQSVLPDLERELGTECEWEDSEMYLSRPESNLHDGTEWPTHHDWLISTLEKLNALLQPAIEAVTSEKVSDDEEDEVGDGQFEDDDEDEFEDEDTQA